MEQETQQQENWREDVNELPPAIKVVDGEIATFAFMDEGKKLDSKDYGESVVFRVTVVGLGEIRSWYVNKNNYPLLKQLKELGTLTGKTLEVTRTGSKKSDTRYMVKTIPIE